MKRRTICIAGAAPDTGNLGVSALCRALVTGLAARMPGVLPVVLDHGRGRRRASLGVNGAGVGVERVGAVNSRRYYRAESYGRIELAARLGGLMNPAARALVGSEAVFSINGGDSFTDLYGTGRLDTVARPMEIALRAGVPLILPPQTYGPFRDPAARDRAATIVRSARGVWARDARSFEVLRELAGDAFNPARYRLGVDVAFGLEPAEPPESAVPDRLRAWWEGPATPVVGVNVSGLIYNSPRSARERYGFLADYRRVVTDLVRRLVEAGARVVLVPHVVAEPGRYESDPAACRAVLESLAPAARERVLELPPISDPGEVKWVIGRFDWFCGTRMHAAIAALSSGVPTAAIAYSPKTLGVFETCGQGAHVADPTRCESAEAVERLLDAWVGRDHARRVLASALPGVRHAVAEQLDQMAGCGAARRAVERPCSMRAVAS